MRPKDLVSATMVDDSRGGRVSRGFGNVGRVTHGVPKALAHSYERTERAGNCPDSQSRPNLPQLDRFVARLTTNHVSKRSIWTHDRTRMRGRPRR